MSDYNVNSDSDSSTIQPQQSTVQESTTFPEIPMEQLVGFNKGDNSNPLGK